jgi:CheY-like chemotaxis protein
MSPRVLIADDDTWILRMVSTVLAKRGYEVDTATDGEEAFTKAVASPPDLLVTDVMMPRMDGWALVRALRARPETALLPVLFLTALSSDEDRIRGFRLGADDYIPKPFRFEELDLRVARVLKRSQGMVQDTRAQLGAPGLEGDLAQVGLASLLTLIELERKSGALSLRGPDGRPAQLLVRDGRVVHARFDDAPEPVDVECVYQLLTWTGGAFAFVACDIEGEDRVQTPTTHLLMEGARLLDEASQAGG